MEIELTKKTEIMNYLKALIITYTFVLIYENTNFMHKMMIDLELRVCFNVILYNFYLKQILKTYSLRLIYITKIIK